MLWLC